MMVVVIYDIDTHDASGRKRIQHIAKECLNWGCRVQESVYECEVNAKELRDMTERLENIMDAESDHLRIYNLGNNYSSRITDLGQCRNDLYKLVI